jgi:hypothetical protein
MEARITLNRMKVRSQERYFEKAHHATKIQAT